MQPPPVPALSRRQDMAALCKVQEHLVTGGAAAAGAASDFIIGECNCGKLTYKVRRLPQLPLPPPPRAVEPASEFLGAPPPSGLWI